MSSKPTIQELMAFVLAQKEQEKEIERKRQRLLKGTPYTEESAATADGTRKSRRNAPKSTKFDDPYPPVKSALAQTIANRRETKKAISMEQIKQICALRFASYEKTSTPNEEAPKDEKPEPMNAEKKRGDDGSVEDEEQENEKTMPVAKDLPAPARQSGRLRKARTPFEAAI